MLWEKFGLTEDDIVTLEEFLCVNPQTGVVTEGTGRLRKLRWALPNQGESGSIRVVYVDFVRYEKIYLISAYPKNEKGELKNVKVDRVRIASLPRFHGQQIKVLREKRNMTQQLFASALGVSKKTVEAWEAGRNVPEGPAQRMLELIEKDEKLFEKYAIVSREQ